LDESLMNTSDAIPLRDSIPDPNFVSPDAAICEQETLEELREQIEELSPKHAQVLRMRVYEKMNYQEIADALGCSLGTVKSRIHYAIRELRARLGDDHANPENDGLYGLPLSSSSTESSWPQS
jgi:RNA polymerase sigma-70 factor (ECF subfamily)